MKSAAGDGRASDLAASAVEDVAALTLDARGMIRYCNQAGETLFKYRRSELVWRHVAMLLPQLVDLELMEDGELNSRLRFLFHTGQQFLAITQEGDSFCGDVFLSILDDTGGGRLSLIVRPLEEADSDAWDRASGNGIHHQRNLAARGTRLPDNPIDLAAVEAHQAQGVPYP